MRKQSKTKLEHHPGKGGCSCSICCKLRDVVLKILNQDKFNRRHEKV